MSETTTAALLTALDPLDYPTRMRRLAEETTRLAAEGRLDAVLDDLAAADGYERRLALTMARIAERPDRVADALTDPLYRIRRRALTVCVRDCGADDAVLATLTDAPPVWRTDVVRAIRAAGRPELADRVARGCLDLGDEENAARALPACSPALAAELLPRLAHRVGCWGSLGRRHPDLALGHVRQVLAGVPEGARDAWWETYGQAVAGAAGTRALEVLDLLEEFPLRAGLPSALLGHINPLLHADEARVLRLLAAPNGALAARWNRLSHETRKRLTATGLPELDLVGRALRDNPAGYGRLLRDVTPSRRSAFYDRVDADRDASHAILAPAVLDALPHERRHAEARRMLTLGAVADDPAQRLSVLARLPWSEALGELRTAVRRAAADDRAQAYPLLVLCAAGDGDPATVTALLTAELGRLRNEQEPVRFAVLTALAAVRPELFEDCDAVTDSLTRLAIDAIEARDVSWQVHDVLRRTAARVMAARPGGGLFAWAVMVFERLAGSYVGMFRHRLDTILRRGQEVAVYQAVEPWVKREMERADQYFLLAFASALGRRAWAIEGLQDALAHAVRYGTNETSIAAVDLWLADPAHRDERTARIIAWEPTAAVLDPVIRVLSRRRTDLLDAYLQAVAVTEGRYIASGPEWFPHLLPSGRWLPRHLDAYAAVLARIAADTGAKTDVRVQAVRDLATLLGHGDAEVLRYVDSPDIPLAEAALGALPWTEDPAAHLPLLFSYADGDRARVAVYAAGRAARYTRPSQAASILRAAALSPTAKVTSRKEALRIAADLRVPDLAGLLSEAWHVEGQHRDVKAAVVSRLPACLDDPRALTLLREASAADAEIVAPLIRLQPVAVPERHRAVLGQSVAALCSHADVRVAQMSLVAAAKWYPWTDSVADAVCAAMVHVDRRMPGAGGSGAFGAPIELNSLVSHGMPIGRYADVVAALLAADDADGTEVAAADRDRPARRRLVWIVRGAISFGQSLSPEGRAVPLAVAEVLAGRAHHLCQVMELLASAVELDVEPQRVTVALAALADRAAGRYDAAERAAAVLVQPIRGKRPWNSAALLAATEALAARPDDLAAGLIAVRLLAVVGPALGWPEPFRVVVSALRRHGDPAVAEAAFVLYTGTG